jgi:DNA ligase (NAD+)
MASELARRFNDLDQLKEVGEIQLQSIEGVGPNIAEAIADWFRRPVNRALIEKLKRLGVWPVAQARERSAEENVLNDLTFVITGTLPTLSRDQAKALIEKFGGKVTDSVSKNTSYLVVGEAAGSKLDKATTLGVPLLDEAGLNDLINKLGQG